MENSNLIFCFNATMPILLLMVLGYLLNKVGIVDDIMAERLNKFVFKLALPLLLFKSLANNDIHSSWDGKYIAFGFIITIISILIMVLVSFLLKDKSIQGEFAQAGFRSSQAILGVAYLNNIYGNPGAAPLMIIASVPLFNICSIMILSLLKEERGVINKELMMTTLKAIVKNPLLIGITVGLIWSFFRIPQPAVFKKTVSSIAGVATPLGLIALGASFDFKKAFGKIKPAIVCTIFKLIVFVAIFIPIAVLLGYRKDKLVAALIMLGSASTVTCFVMAKNMGHEGTLSSSVVMLTTFFSTFTITVWLYILKSFALI